MALSEAQKHEFIDAYTKALLASWSSDEYAARLESDPRSALAEVGLELPEGASIEITRGAADPAAAAQSQEGRLDRQVALYEAGLSSGVFEFHLPATPQIDTSELDIDELAEVAGGMYCCCCPCCCCG